MFFLFVTHRTPPRTRTVDGGYAVEVLGDPRYELELIVTGPTRAQSRPGIRGGALAFCRLYSPSSRYQNAMRTEMRAALFNPVTPIYGRIPVVVELTFFMRRPNSHFVSGDRANNIKPEYSSMEMPHIYTPDLDNMAKFVLDALTGLAFADDKVVFKLITSKIYDSVGLCIGRTHITVTPETIDLTDL